MQDFSPLVVRKMYGAIKNNIYELLQCLKQILKRLKQI